MPFSDYTDALGNIRLEMLSRNGSGVLAGIASELDPVTGLELPLPAEPDAFSESSAKLELSGETIADRLDVAEAKELGHFYNSLANRLDLPDDWSRKDASDLANDLGRDIDRFMAEQAQTGGRIAIAAAAATQPAGQGVSRQQIMVIRRPRSAMDDVPILSSVQLGTIAVEVLKPEIRANPHIGATYHELRQFLMIEERQSASVLMYDQSTGSGILMTVEDGAAKQNNDQMDQSADAAQPRNIKRGAIFDNRPLRDVIIDLLSSKLAIVLYAILLTCWLTWRYVIRKYA